MSVAAGRLEVETADHVVLRYDLAGGGNRGFAAVVDFLVATLIATGIGVACLTFASALGEGVLLAYGGFVLLLGLTVVWAYFIALEWLWNGQTIGKRVFGLRVIGDDGAPPGFLPIFVRNLVRVVDFLPSFYGVGLLAIVLSPRSQRLGDIAAGTYVVRAPRPQLDYFSLRTVTPLGAGTEVATRRLSGEAQRSAIATLSRVAAVEASRARAVSPRSPSSFN